MTELIKSFNKIVTTLSERNWIELNEKNLSTPAEKNRVKTSVKPLYHWDKSPPSTLRFY